MQRPNLSYSDLHTQTNLVSLIRYPAILEPTAVNRSESERVDSVSRLSEILADLSSPSRQGGAGYGTRLSNGPRCEPSGHFRDSSPGTYASTSFDDLRFSTVVLEACLAGSRDISDFDWRMASMPS